MAGIVILGGGVVGTSTALQLRRNLPEGDRIVVVDRQDRQYYTPSLSWIISGKRKPQELYRKTADIFNKKGIEFIQDEATKIQPDKNIVSLKRGRPLTYDILVIATGADYDEHLFPHLDDIGFNLWTMEGVTAFRDKLEDFRGGSIALLAPEMPVKCIGALYEVAFLLKTLFIKKGIANMVKLDIYTPESAPLINFGLPFSRRFSRLLAKQGINIHNRSELKKVIPESRLEFTGKTVDFDLLAYVPPHRGSSVIKDSGLGDEHGWVKADPYFLSTGYQNIFAGGDATGIVTPRGEILPKCGSVATFHAITISRNVLAVLYGKKPSNPYKGTCFSVFENTSGKCIPVIGSFYGKPDPRFYSFPNSKWFRLLKRYTEFFWLRGKPSYPPWV